VSSVHVSSEQEFACVDRACVKLDSLLIRVIALAHMCFVCSFGDLCSFCKVYSVCVVCDFAFLYDIASVECVRLFVSRVHSVLSPSDSVARCCEHKCFTNKFINHVTMGVDFVFISLCR